MHHVDHIKKIFLGGTKMANYKMKELINNSIQVYPGMIVVYPLSSKEEILNVSEIIEKFPGHYATNGPAIAFIHKGNFFVTPYTSIALSTLRANNFVEANFHVPFSKWDYPKAEQCKWNSLREKAATK